MEWLFEKLDPTEFVVLVLGYLPNVIAAIVILFVFWVLYRITRRPLGMALEKAGLHPALVSSMVHSVYRITVLVLALVMAAGQLGINVGAALAGIGVAGIAIGFASQDTLANIIAGFTILIDKPFQVGDWIEVADESGAVSGITLRSTRIRTRNNTYVVIPNKKIIDEVLVNHTKHGVTRIDVPVGIAYKENIPQARKVLLEAAPQVEEVLEDPAPDVVVMDLGNSAVNMEVRVWIDDASLTEPIFSAVMEASKLALDAAGIEIPYHHLQLFIENVGDDIWNKAGLLNAGQG